MGSLDRWVRTREKSGTPLGRAIRGSGRPSWHDQKVFWTLCPLPETIFHFKVSPDTCKPELRDTVLQMSSVFHSSLYRPQVPTILSCALGFEVSSESRLHSSPGWKVLPQVPPAIGSLFPLPSPICLTARITQIFNRTTICAASRLRKASQSC